MRQLAEEGHPEEGVPGRGERHHRLPRASQPRRPPLRRIRHRDWNDQRETTFYVDGRDADLDHVSLGTQGDHKTDSNNYDADARLSALSLNGITLDQTFHNALKQYTASVANSVSSTTVTATKRRDGATVAITPADAESGTTGRQVNLGVGTTVISVTVTASNNTTTKTYTITIERAAS